MKKLALLFFVILNVQTIQASHIVGGELTYQCIGNGNYEITFTFYRDCFGIPAPNSVILFVENSCGIPVSTLTMTSNTPPELINALCSQNSTCNGGTDLGFQKYIYTGLVNLPAGCADWTFSVELTSRNAGITSIVNPDSHNFYISAELNNVNVTCDNSPVFTNNPVIITCINQPYRIDLGGYDSDGDSLVYSFVPPRSGPNSDLPYDSAFSFDHPLGNNSPITLDNNGVLSFTPNQSVYTCYAIQILEYRNGQLIGGIERDIILYAIPCNNTAPFLTGVNGTNIYDISVCAYQPACFYVYSSDPDLTDSTTITWDHQITGVTFINSGAQKDSALFCWTPGASDISTIPHCFTVYVKDNSCPAYQTSSKTFCITVHDTTAICSPVSVGDLNLTDHELLIYPQPASQIIFIDCGEVNFSSKYTLTIVNILGKTIYRSIVKERKTSIDINGILASGIYQAYLTDEKGVVVKNEKFIVLRDLNR